MRKGPLALTPCGALEWPCEAANARHSRWPYPAGGGREGGEGRGGEGRGGEGREGGRGGEGERGVKYEGGCAGATGLEAGCVSALNTGL